jgi:hypothetical protein
MTVADMPLGLVVKLASLVVHVQELDPASPAASFDIGAAKGLADDPEVTAWLETIDPAFLPEKRAGGSDG